MPIAECAPEPAAAAFVKSQKDFLDALMSAPIAQVPRAMSSKKVRFEPSGVASFLLSHVRRSLAKDGVDTDKTIKNEELNALLAAPMWKAEKAKKKKQRAASQGMRLFAPAMLTDGFRPCPANAIIVYQLSAFLARQPQVSIHHFQINPILNPQLQASMQ